MKFKIQIISAILALVVLGACNFQQCKEGTVCIAGTNGPSPIPSATPVASVSPTPSPSPKDPCAPPVTAVYISGPTEVSNGSTFSIDITPVSESGPLAGDLDYCNLKGRTPVVESTSANLRCVGNCSGYKPQFTAQGVGPFSIRIRVDNAHGDFSGTVLR